MNRQIIPLLCGLLLLSIDVLAQPQIDTHGIAENNGQYRKLELEIELLNFAGTTIDPYNWDEIKVVGIFTHLATNTQYTKTGFYYINYTQIQPPPPPPPPQLPPPPPGTCPDYKDTGLPRDPNGRVIVSAKPPSTGEWLERDPNNDPDWRVRFAPPMSGQWHYKVELYYNGTYVDDGEGTFNIGSNSNPGYISKRNDFVNFPSNSTHAGAYLFDNGDAYFPTGTNLELYKNPYCRSNWDLHSTQSYKQILNKLSAAGGNFARVIMSGDEWGTEVVYQNPNNSLDPDNGKIYRDGFVFKLEWGRDAVLGNYDQRQNYAFLFDELLDHCETKNIYLQIVLNTYALVAWGWDENPYSKITKIVNGHPVNIDPREYYSNPTAIAYKKRYMSYIAARWGYSTNIFAWETLGEADLTNTSQAINWNDVINWINIMNLEMKSVDPNHMTMISTGTEWWEDPTSNPPHPSTQVYNINSVDIIDHHAYGSGDLYNFADYRRGHLLRKVAHYGKPILTGEFGESEPYDGHGDLFTRTHGVVGNVKNTWMDFHNSIWASSFSGQSGTSSYWLQNIFYNTSPAYKHIQPLRTLIDQIDFKNEDFDPISTACDQPDPAFLAMDPNPGEELEYFKQIYYNGEFDKCLSYTNGVEIELTASPATTFTFPGSLESKVSISALKGTDNMYGWIHKKDNFWWKLPHSGWKYNSTYGGGLMGSQMYDRNCPYFPGVPSNNFPSNPDDCENYTLQNVEAVFNDVCNGEYRVDYYATYPTHQNGDNGGIISELSDQRVFTGNNNLHFKLPKLEPLSDVDHIHEPDYGFHIRKINPENYKYKWVSSGNPAENAIMSNSHKPVIETFYKAGPFVTKIFYKGQNDYMHYYWYDPGTNVWTWGPVNAGTLDPNEKINGDIATNNYNEGEVYFVGADNRIRTYEYVGGNPGGSWQQSCVKNCSTLSSEWAAVNCNIEATDEQVFYKGTNSKLLMYTKTGTGWQHTMLDQSNQGWTNEVGNYISVPKDPQASTDVVFFVNKYNQICVYEYDVNTSTWVLTTLTQKNPQQVPLPAVWKSFDILTPISSAYVGQDNDLYVFYRGANSMIQYYKKTANGWQHGQLSETVPAGSASAGRECYFDSHMFFDDDVLYYYTYNPTVNGDMNTIGRYYWDDVFDEWRFAYLGICPANRLQTQPNQYQEDLKFFRYVAGGHFVYVDDNTDKIFMYENVGDCEKCTGEYMIPNYKPGKPDPLEELTAELEGKKAQMSRFSSDDNNYQMVVYPNPAYNEVNIVFNNRTTDNATIKVVNTLGATVKEIPLTTGSNKYKINVGGLPRGLYYLHLIENSGKPVTTKKLTLY